MRVLALQLRPLCHQLSTGGAAAALPAPGRIAGGGLGILTWLTMKGCGTWLN